MIVDVFTTAAPTTGSIEVAAVFSPYSANIIFTVIEIHGRVELVTFALLKHLFGHV